MKHPFRTNFAFLLIIVFIFTAIALAGPGASFAQEGTVPGDDPANPKDEGTSPPSEEPTSSNQPEQGQDGLINDFVGLPSGNQLSIPFVEPQTPSVTDSAIDGFLYVLQDDAAGNFIHGFNVDAVTGALTSLGSPVSAGGEGSGGNTVPERMVYDSTNKRLLVVNSDTSGAPPTPTLSVFSVDRSDGSLTSLFTPAAVDLKNYYSVCVHPTGSPAVIGATDGTIYSYEITSSGATKVDTETGALSFNWSCEFTPDGDYLFVGGDGTGGGRFASFQVNQSSGELTYINTYITGSGSTPRGLEIDESNRLFLIGGLGAVSLRAYTTSSGVPTQVSSSPFSSGVTAPFFGLIHPAGFYMAADVSPNQVGVYKISGSGAGTTLTSVGGPYATGGSGANTLAVSRTGAYVYAAHWSTRNITTFKIDVETGALTSLGTGSGIFATGWLNGMAFVPVTQPAADPGGFVYALQEVPSGDNYIFGFREDKNSGMLTPLAGFPVATGGTGAATFLSEHITFDPVNRRLYVTNNGSETLSAFSVNQATGAISSVFSPVALTGVGWHGVCVHPSGTPVIVGDTAGTAETFAISANSATPVESEASVGWNWGCDFTSDDAYVFLGGHNTSGQFSSFSVNSTSGDLSLVGNHDPGLASSQQWPEIDNNDRLFMTNFNTGDLYAYTTSSGVPTAASGNPYASGLGHGSHLILHPNGYLMVADRNNNQVGSFAVTGSGASTSFSAVSGSPFKTGATGSSDTQILALNDDAELLYTANADSRSITTFDVNTSTGQLNGLFIQPNGSVGSTGRITGMVYVNFIKADFNANPTSGPVNLTVRFNNLSEGNYTNCSWNFGDTHTSTSCGNPSHTYTEPDTYSVSLRVSGPGGSNTRTRTSYITAENALVYMPVVLKNFCGGFARARELEDNDTDTEANGPLCLFKTYAASPDSDIPGQESDYYYINWDGGQFTVSVTNFLTSKAQVQLYYRTVADRKAFLPDQASGNYVITYNGAPGKYLIRVVAEAGHAVGNGDYNLRVTRP